MVLRRRRWGGLETIAVPVRSTVQVSSLVTNKRLGRYNVTPTAAYQYAPAYRRYGQKINAVHFIGSNKPWFNLAGRPAGMSYAKGKDASFDCTSMICPVYSADPRRPIAH